MPIPPNQVEVVEIQQRGIIAAGGSSSVNTNFSWFFKRTSTVPPIDHEKIDIGFQAAIGTVVAAALNARWSQQNNAVRWVNDALDAPMYYPHVLAGSIAGDSMAATLSVYLLLRTGIRGKSYRGSKHLAPASESDTTGGGDDILNAAALVRFNNIAGAVLAGFTDTNGNTWVPVIVSRKLSQLVTNPTTVVANQVTSILTNRRLGRMKRRLVASVY